MRKKGKLYFGNKISFICEHWYVNVVMSHIVHLEGRIMVYRAAKIGY